MAWHEMRNKAFTRKRAPTFHRTTFARMTFYQILIRDFWTTNLAHRTLGSAYDLNIIQSILEPADGNVNVKLMVTSDM